MAISEWTITVDALNEFAVHVGERGRYAMSLLDAPKEDLVSHLLPGEDQCKFCKAKANCPKLDDLVQTTIGDEFEVIAADAALGTDYPPAELATKMAACDLIEEWIKAIRGKVESDLLAGVAVPGYKLVEGRQGNRAWSNDTEAEAMIKTMRVPHDQMYQYKIISPTTAEKLAKAGTIGPRQWPKLQAMITRSDGKPSVAPESDKRPALVIAPVADEFVAIETADDLI
jgi:hypothetical protein